MLKAFKGLKKKLGSSARLNEQAGVDVEAQQPALDAAPQLAPASLRFPPHAQASRTSLPEAPAQLQRSNSLHAADTGPAKPELQRNSSHAAIAAPEPPSGLPPRPHSTPSLVSTPQHPPAAQVSCESVGELSVDYELAAGPLELDAAEHHRHASPTHDRHAHDHSEDSDGHETEHHAWHDSAPASPNGPADQAGVAGGNEGRTSGDGGRGTEAARAEGLTDALATMMYLTEEPGHAEDCVSVVSDALSEEDLPDDISELSRALEALEGEALGSSPASTAGASMGVLQGGLDDQLAERLGIAPDAGDPAAYSQQMAKLYNNLGLKMMERRKHEEALGLLRKAEAIVENEAVWGSAAQRRRRMQAITYNNLGCLFKRRALPQLALAYLQKALALEEGGGPVQNSSSTHLNISAAYSALKKPKEALVHAERAIIMLQRHLWPHHLPFQDGLSFLVRQLSVAGAPSRTLLASANVLAMAYHNAAVEHEKLGHLREALVSFTRAYLIVHKCMGGKAQMTVSMHRALKAFQQRQARYLPTGAAHAARKAASLTSTRAPAPSTLQAKRGAGHSRGGSKSVAAKSSGSLASKSMGSLVAAAASGKATLPLDKASKGTLVGARPASASRLISQAQP